MNRPIFRNWIQRNTATNCATRVTILDANSNVVLRDTSTEWVARPEPFRVVSILPEGRPILAIDDYLVSQADRLDVYANRFGESFAVVVKVDEDPNCYLFRGESYRSGDLWRLPQYRIPEGDLTLEVYLKADNA